jgi:hypothetical protein
LPILSRHCHPGRPKVGPGSMNHSRLMIGICGSRLFPGLTPRSAGMTFQNAMPGTSPGMANSQAL